MPSSRKLLMAPLLLVVAVAPAAAAPFLHERFDGQAFPPAGWTVIDNAGSGVVWSNIAGSFEAGNYTGGSGDAASVSSDQAGFLEFDTELRSPVVSLPPATPIGLHFLANYLNFLSSDFLEVDYSTDGGTGWTNLLSWNEDHGADHAPPGECVNLDLSSLAGAPSFMLRFRYFDPNFADWDWYAQIDELLLDDQLTSSCALFLDGFEIGDTSAWSSTVPPPPVRAVSTALRPVRAEGERQPLGGAEAVARHGEKLRQRRLEKARADQLLPAPPEHRAPPPASVPPGR